MQILTIAGNVGKEPVLRQTQSGDDLLGFSLAVDMGKDKPAQWYDCTIWGKRATALQPHIGKGTKLCLTGRPTARAHEGKAYLGINVDQLTFMGGGNRSGERQETQRDDSGYSGGGRPMPDDSIPF